MRQPRKTITKKKKCKKAEWLSEEAFQIAEERRQAESKGERERYIQLSAKFQRTAWKDKKAFFNEQCKQIEENNRKGNTRDLFKKTGTIKRTSHPKMGTIKERNDKNVIEAEEIKMRWKEYREEM